MKVTTEALCLQPKTHTVPALTLIFRIISLAKVRELFPRIVCAKERRDHRRNANCEKQPEIL